MDAITQQGVMIVVQMSAALAMILVGAVFIARAIEVGDEWGVHHDNMHVLISRWGKAKYWRDDHTYQLWLGWYVLLVVVCIWAALTLWPTAPLS